MIQQSLYFGDSEVPDWVIRKNALKGSSVVGVDTETNGLFGSLRLLQISENPKSAYVVERSEGVDTSALSERTTVWCNGGFDWHGLASLGYRPKQDSTVDIFLASQVLWAGVLSARHGLAAIAKRYLGISVDKTLQAQDWGKPQLDPDDYTYAALDARLTRACYEPTMVDLRKADLLSVAQLEWRSAHVFWEIEHYGTYLRVDFLEDALDKYKAARAKAAKKFREAFPGVNIASPAQVFRVFRDKGLTFDQRTQSFALRLLNDPYADLVCLWRSLTKYIEKIKALIDACEDCEFPYPWKTVRTRFRQIAYQADREAGLPGKGMGRSSSGPPINWQNIAKLPDLFERMGLPNQRSAVCPPPGYAMVDIDLSQAHARIACAESRDPYLIDVFKSGKDIHSEVAFELLRQRGSRFKSAAEVKKAAKAKETDAVNARGGAKKGFFGNLNGQGYTRLWQSCWEEDTPIKITKDEAQAIQGGLRKKLVKLERFKRKLVDQANADTVTYSEHVYGRLIGPTKRRQHFLKKPVVGKLEWQPVTSIHAPQAYIFWWMGAEASVLKGAANEIYAKRNPEWDLRFQGFFHDELLFICKEKFKLEAAIFIQTIVRKWMRAVLKGVIPCDEGESPDSLIIKDWSVK